MTASKELSAQGEIMASSPMSDIPNGPGEYINRSIQEQSEEQSLAFVTANPFKQRVRYRGATASLRGSNFGSPMVQFAPEWKCMSAERGCKLARQIRGSFGFISTPLRLKESFGKHGFHFKEGFSREWAKSNQGFNFKKIVDDVWFEYMTTDNAVLYWGVNKHSSGLPMVYVPDCEDVKICASGKIYLRVDENSWGNYSNCKVEVKLGDDAMTVEQVIRDNGGWLPLNMTGLDEYGTGITGGKHGAGLSMPKISELFFDLATHDQLRSGDWNAAFKLKEIIRHVKKGHEIRYGPNAGQPHHFATKKQLNVLEELFGEGLTDLFTQFDVEVGYKFLDPAYMMPQKYQAVESRIAIWMGPIHNILTDRGEISEALVQVFMTELIDRRENVKFMLEEMFNHESFHGGNKPAERVEVDFSPFTHLTPRALREMLSTFYRLGVISPQSVREELGFDSMLESQRNKEAHKDREGFTPPFEAGQGMLFANDDRPQDREGGAGNEIIA